MFPIISPEASMTWELPVSVGYAEREYQRTIALSCLLRNTLVALPTGLGKTFIASCVMHNFSRWYPTGAVVFMAPTRPLVT